MPVEWEALFAWTNVPANSKVAITNIGFVQMDETTVLAPASQSVSGLGTVADPLKVLLTFNPSQFNPTPNNQIIGPLKVFLDYNFMNTIPEPTSAVLALLGLVGFGRLDRRR